jgi:hypothetical protein
LPTNEYAVWEDVDLAGRRVEVEPHVDPASGAASDGVLPDPCG